MSRGRGHVERRIMAALRREPDLAFTSAELCSHVYGVATEARHRSSVLRAMHRLAAAEPTVAPLQTIRGTGSAIYRSGSISGECVARAKLTLLDAQRCRIEAKPLNLDDEAWLRWAHIRKLFRRRFQPEELAGQADVLARVKTLQRKYALSLVDASALLGCYGSLVADRTGLD